MSGSGQVEQVSVRFQADINQYIQAVAQAKKILNDFTSGAEGATAKAMGASVKVVQNYSKIAQESAKVVMAQAKVEKATIQAAIAHERLTQHTNNVNNSMGNMNSALRGVIGQYLSLGIVLYKIVGIFKDGIDFNKFMEVSTTAFGVMMKSVDMAKAKMEELFNYAVNSPLTFRDVVSASRQLMAYGFAAKELVPTIDMLGIVAKATGVQLGDMAYVYGTLRSQGRAYTRDLMQFAMRGIPIYDELAKVIGKPVKELQKLTEEGKIGFKEVEQAFRNMTTGTGTFSGFFEEYMKTFEGKMSMLTDVYQQATGKLTKALFETMKPMIDDLTRALRTNGDAFESWGRAIGAVIVLLERLKEAIAVLAIGALAAKISTLGITIAGIVKVIGGPITAIIALMAFFKSQDAYTVRRLNEIQAAQDTAKARWKALLEMQADYRDAGASNNSTFSAYSDVGAGPYGDRTKGLSAQEMDAMDRLLVLLRKYQNEWDKIKAENLVKNEKDMYAVVNLENRLRMEQMKKEFEGNDVLKNQALAIQKLIHADAIHNIDMQLKAKEQALLKEAALEQAKGDAQALQFTIDQDNAVQDLMSAFDKLTNSTDTNPVQELLTAITMEVDRLKEHIAEATTDPISGHLADITDLEGKASRLREILQSQQNLSDAEKKRYDDALEVMGLITAATEAELILAKKLEEKRVKFASIEGTDVGSLLIKGDPIAMMVEAAIKFLLSMENVSKVLNFFSTILEGARAILEPLINGALQPVVNILLMIGEVLAQLLSPFISLIAIVIDLVYKALSPLIAVVQMVGAAFAWLNDNVIVPFGNAVIDTINGVIDGMNGAFGWLGVHITKLDKLLTTVEAQLQTQALKTATDALGQTIDYLKNKLNDSINSQIKSYRDLYNVGALSASNYAANVAEANAMRPAEADLVSYADKQLTTQMEMSLRLANLYDLQDRIDGNKLTDAQKLAELIAAGINTGVVPSVAPSGGGGSTGSNDASNQALIDSILPLYEAAKQRLDNLDGGPAAASANQEVQRYRAMLVNVGYTGSYASGSPNIPNDMFAQVHQGEGIIPSTFMDSIRKGELSLSGRGGGSVNVVVNVAGNVRAEKDLATTIATEIYRQRRSGLLTV